MVLKLKNLISIIVLFQYLSGCGVPSSLEQAELNKLDPVSIQFITFQGSEAESVLKGGAIHIMSWPLVTGQPTVVTIEYSTGNENEWISIEPYISNLGLYIITLPQIDVDIFNVRIIDPATSSLVARSISSRIVSTPPSLKSQFFVSREEISAEEFHVNSIGTLVSVVNPLLNGHIWTINFDTLTNSPAGLSVQAIVSHSQLGGVVICENTTCQYQAPATSSENDEFQIQLFDLISPNPNQSEIITVTVQPRRLPNGSSQVIEPTDLIPQSAPVLIPIGDIQQARDPNEVTDCPDLNVAPDSTTYRICNSDDIRPGCSGARTLRTYSTETLHSWTSNLSQFLSTLPANATLEIVYNNAVTNTGPSGVPNTHLFCDQAINQNQITIKGVCGDAENRPLLKYATFCPENQGGDSKGILINNGENNKIINLSFGDCNNNPKNCTAIYDLGKNTRLSNLYFMEGNIGYSNLFNNQPESSSFVVISNSKFENQGYASNGNGSAISVGKNITHLLIENSLILRTQGFSSYIRTEAQETTIQCSVVSGRDPNGGGADSNWRDDSLLYVPRGGLLNMSKNTLVKGSKSNSGPVIMKWATNTFDKNFLNFYQRLTFTDNYILNRKTSAYFLNYGSFLSSVRTEATLLDIRNNKFSGLGSSYVESNFFSLRAGTDLSYDITLSPYFNDILANELVPYTGVNSQYVPRPGGNDTPSNCPDFVWQ